MSYSWFKKGTCVATNGSKRVNFSGADITTAPNKPVVGDAFMIDYSNIYEVTFIGNDATGEYIMLDREFAQASTGNVKYVMMRLASSNQNAALVAKASAAINQKQISLDDMYEWYTSQADTVDFTGVDGVPVTVPTYHKMTVDIGSVSTVTAEIKTVADNIADVNTVAGNVADVNATGQNIASVVAVHTNEANINAVNANKGNIDTVAGDVANVNLVAGSVSNVNTVATNIATIENVSTNMQAVLDVPGHVQHIDQQVTHVDQQTTIATDAATNAGNSETQAEAFKNKADQFANAPVGVDVEPGKKSAFHWSEQARNNANQTFVSGGLFKPQAGNEYPDVTGVARDTIWIVEFDTHDGTYTFTTGALAGKVAQNADQIFYDTPSNTFALIPVSRAGILSVDGDAGPNVNLEGKYFFDGNRPAVAQVTGLQTALDSKFSATNRPTIGNVVDLQNELDSKYSAANKPNPSDIGAMPASDASKFVAKSGATGAALVPAGPTSERPDPASLPANTMPFRYNTDLKEWEGLDGENNYASIGGGGLLKPIKPAPSEYPYTVKKNKILLVDVSDGISKVAVVPTDLREGDGFAVALTGWSGDKGVTARIQVDPAQEWDVSAYPTGANLVIGGNQIVAIQKIQGGKLKLAAVAGEGNEVIDRGHSDNLLSSPVVPTFTDKDPTTKLLDYAEYSQYDEIMIQYEASIGSKRHVYQSNLKVSNELKTDSRWYVVQSLVLDPVQSVNFWVDSDVNGQLYAFGSAGTQWSSVKVSAVYGIKH